MRMRVFPMSHEWIEISTIHSQQPENNFCLGRIPHSLQAFLVELEWSECHLHRRMYECYYLSMFYYVLTQKWNRWKLNGQDINPYKQMYTCHTFKLVLKRDEICPFQVLFLKTRPQKTRNWRCCALNDSWLVMAKIFLLWIISFKKMIPWCLTH